MFEFINQLRNIYFTLQYKIYLSKNIIILIQKKAFKIIAKFKKKRK